MDSKDYSLGKRIQQLLINNNLENPMLVNNIDHWDNESYLQGLSAKLSTFLEALGFDLSDDSIKKTPSRVVKFLINESFCGLNYRNFPRITTNINTYKYDKPLVSNGITVNSTCEHHLVSISGFATVAYIPDNKIVGLSKINRVVDFFARRPQVQERMTRQIFIALQDILETEDVAVAINATHNCIAIRGVKNSDTENLTIAMDGKFLLDETLKNTFYNLAFTMKSR
ncbi:MAG: GTP cyclohydrolase I FolE [Neisseriaceae bacterium]